MIGRQDQHRGKIPHDLIADLGALVGKLFPQIRTASARVGFGSLAPPPFDLCMIARAQDVGYGETFPFCRARIMRIFKEAAFKAFLLATEAGAHDAGEKPHDGVQQHQRAHFSAGQDNVAHRDLLNLGAGFEQAFIKAFKPAAEDGDAGTSAEFTHAGLGDGLASGGHGEDGVGWLCCNASIDRRGEDIAFQDHASAAACGRIIDGAMLVGRKVTDLQSVEAPAPLLHRAARHRMAQRSGEHIRVKRKDLGGESHVVLAYSSEFT